jgi:hypothetical protein
MICYQFPNRATWRQLAIQTGLAARVNGEFQLLSGHGIAIDEVGSVVTVDAVVDAATGNVITPPVLAPGFHVNLIHPDPPEELDSYLIMVNSPSRIFFGQDGSVPDDETVDAISAVI